VLASLEAESAQGRRRQTQLGHCEGSEVLGISVQGMVVKVESGEWRGKS
jgi:hypothetical protein